MISFLSRRKGSSEDKTSWLTWAARFGYAACGTVYLAIGLAAVAVALGIADDPAGAHDVMVLVASQPFGPFALAALGIGLAGYAALNFAGAISDPERRGVSLMGLITRAVDILTGTLYISLALAALGIVMNPADNATKIVVAWAATVLALPFGKQLLAMIGGSLIVSGGYLFYRTSQEPFGEMLDRRSLSPDTRRWIVFAARVGTAARGVIFVVCGLFAIRAAITSSAESVGDVGDALATVGSTTFGPVLLAAVGAGFIAYGGYQLAKARYQRIATSD